MYNLDHCANRANVISYGQVQLTEHALPTGFPNAARTCARMSIVGKQECTYEGADKDLFLFLVTR